MIGVCSVGTCGSEACQDGWSCAQVQTSATDLLFTCVPGDLWAAR